MPAAPDDPTMRFEMYAREVEEARASLKELRLTEREDLALAVLAFGAALAATQLYPQLAFPLFLGGVVVGVLGIRAVVREWDLVDRLTGDCDAYVIPRVAECAAREATLERRSMMAATIRAVAPAPDHPNESRIEAVTAELETLARDLEDDALELDPAAAVACMRLFTEVDRRGPLFDEFVPVEELRARIRHVLTGFTPAARRRGPCGKSTSPHSAGPDGETTRG
jgi:hypothetical protein